LHFAGTEVAPIFGGYIEGALEAAENVLDVLN
jgi:monoamine oxidase